MIVATVIDLCTSPASGAISTGIGVFFVGMSGSILSDLWLDKFMQRSRRTATFLSSTSLAVGAVSLAFQPFG